MGLWGCAADRQPKNIRVKARKTEKKNVSKLQ